MKNFATPIAIVGTMEQLEEIAKELKTLGYSESLASISNNDDMIITCSNGHCHKFLFVHNNSDGWLTVFGNTDKNETERIKVLANDKDLVLALAAMVDDDKPYLGEYWLNTSPDYNGTVRTRLGKIIEIRKVDNWIVLDSDPNNGWNPYVPSHRKATKEEIINHFTKQPQVGEWNMEEKAIIGYKVKRGINNEAAAKALGYTRFNKEIAFEFNENARKKAQLFGILDLLFEPVYEQEKKIIAVEYSKKGQTLKIEVYDNKAHFNDGLNSATFVKKELVELLKPTDTGSTKFKPTYFDVGCNGQYKNVSAEGIQKVIDALN